MRLPGPCLDAVWLRISPLRKAAYVDLALIRILSWPTSGRFRFNSCKTATTTMATLRCRACNSGTRLSGRSTHRLSMGYACSLVGRFDLASPHSKTRR
ncbi:hypothetical protein HYPSUDRAFT_575722 [Hypholoma sublateritium FD-334 SS-4]|uniref:Uncharacterized protein n=1 Tax=Hypholoma sublateritium (strain FD-334 SS-4) TaxID=945553 RepID=A0A0D2NXU8_HYPSF|nr:hypothetical protein HYPSUDRAFT_575722 [Hypholoma sublateritium FD-334 SS-4]